MGNVLGNIAGLVVVVIALVLSSFSFGAGTWVLTVAAYGFFIFLWFGDVITRPSRGSQIHLFLSDSESDAYRKYHIFIMFPSAGQAQSAFLNLLRLVGFVWGLVALWKGEYWSAPALLAYFFVVGFACLRFDPVRYMLSAAQSGNEIARRELMLIGRIQDRRDLFNGTITPPQSTGAVAAITPAKQAGGRR